MIVEHVTAGDVNMYMSRVWIQGCILSAPVL